MPTTIEALILIALVISPGYICARFMRDVIFLSRDPGDIRFLLPAITCGTLVHILMAFWSIRILDYYRAETVDDNIRELTAWGIVVGFIAPVTIGTLVSQVAKLSQVDQLLDRIGMGYVDRMPSAWEYATRARPKSGSYVRVFLKGSEIPIGGVFGTDSFASNEIGREDLYLQEILTLDANGQFAERRNDNWGSWISHDAIERVEFFEGTD